MPAASLIASANGKLDLEKAFSWDTKEILIFVNAVAKDPEGHGVQEQDHIAPGLDKLKKSLPIVAGIIDNLAKSKKAFDPTQYLPERNIPTTCFDDFPLPLFTIFDYLGWILSLTAYPAASVTEVTEENFFLPLAAVFQKWCTVISSKKFAPNMTHISYWNDHITGKLFTLLGATPGNALAYDGIVISKTSLDKQKAAAKYNDTPRSHVMIRNRQEDLKQIGIPAPDPAAQEVTVDGIEQEIGYGRCAETMFYIWAGSYVAHHGKDAVQPKVHGFALAPKPTKSKAFIDGATYDGGVVKNAVVAPCKESCQDIMLATMKKKWEWEPDFAINPEVVPRPGAVKVLAKVVAKA